MKKYGQGERGSRIRRTMRAAAVLLMGLCTLTGTVQAKEETFVSNGSLVYADGRGKMEWYAEDLVLLREKLSSASGQCYDPACYTHDHCWVYSDINEKTHKRHCDGCGNAFDLTNAHTAAREESCVISHGEETYSGVQYVCECGWQWIREARHTLLFAPVDAISHTSRCALEGTAYCQGYEPVTEEHYAYYYEPGADGAHHEKICFDCGYREEEVCSFTLGNSDSDGASETEKNVRWCVCGNCMKQEEPEAPAGDEEPAEDEEPEAPAEDEKPAEDGEPEPPAEDEKPAEDEEPEAPAEDGEPKPTAEDEELEEPAEDGEPKPSAKEKTPAENAEVPKAPVLRQSRLNHRRQGGL